MRAYVTLLTDRSYLPGVLALRRSLIRVGSREALHVALGAGVDAPTRRILSASGVPALEIGAPPALDPGILQANSDDGSQRWSRTFEKLLIFDLAGFEKIVYLDCDVTVLANIDRLFEAPDFSAVRERHLADPEEGRAASGFNAGVLVIAPSPGRSAAMFALMPQLRARNAKCGDQDVLNLHFQEWPTRRDLHLDDGFNMRFAVLQHYVWRHGYGVAGGRAIGVAHFVGARKPWMWSRRKIFSALLRATAGGRWSEARVLARYVADLAAAQASIRAASRRS